MFNDLSTSRLTDARQPSLGLGMAKRKLPIHQSAMPLIKLINEGKFTKSVVALKLHVLPQHVTNWLKRGIPAKRLHDVADLCGLSTDEYRREAGLPTHARGKQGTLDAGPFMQDFEALPPALQVYAARKTAELRTLYEGLPAWLRDKLQPPKDMDQYRAWERDIEALMLKFRGNDGPPLE